MEMTARKEAPRTSLFKLAGIAKTYNAKDGPVLQVESLEIPRGEVVAVIGFSGSGKTTLLSILSMLERPDDRTPDGQMTPSIIFSPEPEAEGHEILRLPDDRRQKLRSTFGFVFQQGYLLENLSCAENIRVPSQIRGRVPNASVAERLMSMVGLGDSIAKRPPADLSGGERQRVSVLRAVGHGPSIVFADEPTSSLDEANARVVLDGLRGWCKAAPNRTVILVTHNINHAVRYADRVILMAAGRLRGPLPVAAGWGEPITAAALSTMLAEFSGEGRGGEREKREPFPVDGGDGGKRAKWLRFIFSFAMTDVFPRVSAASDVPLLKRLFTRSPMSSLLGRRNAQAHAMASMFFAILLGLFFAGLYSALRNQFRCLVDDGRIAHVEVLGHRDGEQLLSSHDLEQLAGLAYAADRSGVHVATPEQIRTGEARRVGPAVQGAAGYRIREMDCVRNSGAGGFSRITRLAFLSTRATDPILDKIETVSKDSLEPAGDPPSEAHGVTLASVLNNSPDSKIGVICTRTALKQLGFTGTYPKSIEVNPPFSSNGAVQMPLLGVVDWLPKSADAIILEDLWQKLFFAGGSGDALPRFESIDVYLADLMKDGLGIYGALEKLGYSVDSDRLGLLRWVTSVVGAIRYFSLAAGAGVLLVVMISLIISYTEAIRRKEKQIGMLLAYGAPMGLLYALFLAEIAIVWLVAVAFAIPLHLLVSGTVQRLIAQGFQTHCQTAPPMAWGLPGGVLAASLGVAALSVLWTLKRVIDPSRVAESLRAQQ